jgi:hypothetical protein
VACAELGPGDLLKTEGGWWLPVEEVYDTGEYERVYNLRVSDFHTYFVGTKDWGFAVWAHNQYLNGPEGAVALKEFADGRFAWVDKDGKIVPSTHPNNRIPLGNRGEMLGRAYLEERGFKWVGQLKNNSNMGLDGVYLKDGKLYIVDVKTSTKSNFHLEKLQKLGPVKYAELQIDSALTGTPPQWKAMPPGTKEFAVQLRDLLTQYKGKVDGVIVKVPNSGVDPSQIYHSSWVAVTPKKP